MEDKTKEGSEEEILAGADEEKTTFTKDEVDAMMKEKESNSEKGVQKVISETKNYKSAMGEISKVADDKEHLISLYDENPDVAKIILDTVYEGQSIDDFKEAIGYKEDVTDPNVIKKLVKQEAIKMNDVQKIDDAKAEFIKRLNLEGDELKDFEEAFQERTELKRFKASDVTKHLEKAIREVSEDEEMLKNLKKQRNIGKTMATGDSKGGGEAKKDNSANKQASDFLKKHNII